MPELIQLPNDATALLRTNDELSNREAKEIRKAARKLGVVGQKLKSLGLDDVQKVAADENASEADKEAANAKSLEIFSTLSDDEMDNLDLFGRACAVVRLIEWSLDRPLPKDVDEVDDLPRPIYAVLTKEAAKIDLNESFDKDDGLMDPKADTTDSDNSKQHSEEDSF